MINETLTANGESAVSTPTVGRSEIEIKGAGTGQVYLKQKTAGSSAPFEWAAVGGGKGIFVIDTPDLSVEYGFFAINVVGDIDVYFGP